MSVLLVLLMASLRSSHSTHINNDGCGSTKSCLIKPVGCKPEQDCTLFVKFNVDGKNLLHIQMVALAIIPFVPLQYIAVGFSNDKYMGDDMVIECVISTDGKYGYFEPEVYTSYNYKAANDRTYLSEADREIYFRNISGGVEDERIYCEFWVQIIPQISRQSNRTWELNKDYYILAATGTAQPDELNAHDTSPGSHFYPVISETSLNPAKTGTVLHDLSDVSRNSNTTTVDQTNGNNSLVVTEDSNTTVLPTSSATPLNYIFNLYAVNTIVLFAALRILFVTV